MFNSTLWLTLATLVGLAAGFAREWLLVAAWGAGGRSDAFLVALFLPEALRMTMAGGLLAAAALPLYSQRSKMAQQHWLNGLSPWLLSCSLLLAGLFAVGAPLWVRLIGPGLDDVARDQAVGNLYLLAACAPGFVLHALLSIPLQARERFVLAGLGSLMFNLPAVIYLGASGANSQPQHVALACVLGSLLMPLSLLIPVWRLGWRPYSRNGEAGAGRELLSKLGPLLGSNLASQALALLERMVASMLGEGAVTWINLARKLINLPLIALMNLNQVLLGMMSAQQGAARLGLLKQGLAAATILSVPASLGLVGASPTLVAMLLPGQVAGGPLPLLLAWFAVPLVFGAWNALLARYAYAAGDTSLPLRCELLGSLCAALLLISLPFAIGLIGVALAALAGVVVTGLLLMQRQGLLASVDWVRQWLLSLLLLGIVAAGLYPLTASWLQLGLCTLVSSLVLMALAAWLKPWRA
jgi:peptidoglycan biosynthesis protein MviN/MurJ (putative lipid II flippase)